APILWRIFYDPLLVAVDRVKQSTGYAITRPIRQVTDATTTNTATNNLQETTHINHLAFVDDTAWIANSHDGANKILAIADDFFRMNDILINTQKTETFVVKDYKLKNTSHQALSFGGEPLHISGENTPHR